MRLNDERHVIWEKMQYSHFVCGFLMLIVIYTFLFMMYRHYHLETFRRFVSKDHKEEFDPKTRRLLYRKATPFRQRKRSESWSGGNSISFEHNIRKLRPVHGTPSMPTLKLPRSVEEEDEDSENIKITINIQPSMTTSL